MKNAKKWLSLLISTPRLIEISKEDHDVDDKDGS